MASRWRSPSREIATPVPPWRRFRHLLGHDVAASDLLELPAGVLLQAGRGHHLPGADQSGADPGH